MVHDLPLIFHYWSNKYLRPNLEPFGFQSPNEFYLLYLKKACQSHPDRTCQFISLGAGNGDTEIGLAQELVGSGVSNFRVECADLNPDMLDRGCAVASKAGLDRFLAFTERDLNGGLSPGRYDIVLANQRVRGAMPRRKSIGKASSESGPFVSDPRNTSRASPSVLSYFGRRAGHQSHPGPVFPGGWQCQYRRGEPHSRPGSFV